MKDAITEKLGFLGYTVTDADGPIIDLLIAKVTQTIKNECNVDEVPDGLFHVAVDMVCGEFLFLKQATGQLENFDTEAAVNSIKQGDTTVSFAVGDEAITFAGLVDRLMNGGRGQFYAFRRLRW